MIVILVSIQSPKWKTMLESDGHSVIFETSELSLIVAPLIEWSPHLVLVEALLSRELGLFQELKETFNQTRFVHFEGSKNPNKLIQRELCRTPIAPSCDTKSIPQRKILFDSRYGKNGGTPFFHETKRRGVQSSELDIQELKLKWMLRTARKNRNRVQTYRQILTQHEGAEFQEIGFRLAEGTIHGPIYARSQIGRYLGLLAHSVPGADIDCVPLPTDSPAEYRFVPYSSDVRLLYSLNCLSLFGFQQEIYEQLLTALDWHYSKQTGDPIIRIGLAMCGCLFALRAIVTSHLATLDWLLDPKTPELLTAQAPRSLYRARQTFVEFWGFDQIFGDSKRLRTILNKISADISQPDLTDELKPPSFCEFYNTVRSSG